MSQNVFAVLLDALGIQEYVFGSNKLRENLGASSLVQKVFDDYLREALEEIFPEQAGGFDWKLWAEEPESNQLGSSPFDVGYLGGGNGLLFFSEKQKAQDFITLWTRNLLLYTPGIVPCTALSDFDLSDFESSLQKLFHKLHQNKSSFRPQTTLARHGITAECQRSGLSMEIWNKNAKAYVSSATNARLEEAKQTQDDLNREFADLLGEDYTFTNELDYLGQSRDEDSYIAIVHIDGNDMGERFQKMTSLADIRRLSQGVKKSVQKSFYLLLEHIMSHEKDIENFLDNFYRDDQGKRILPLRPIIMGGDDITFVGEGRLGIYLAQVFMEKLEEVSSELDYTEVISSCGGVAITKTKYPFYRGYELSEQLCQKAKEERKSEKSSASWIDFHIAYGGFSGTLDEIRDNHYCYSSVELLFRPYTFEKGKEISFETAIKNLQEITRFPGSKLKELREILTLGPDERERFVAEQKHQNRSFPEYKGRHYHEKLVDNKKTPYFDLVELTQFYPDFAYQKGEK